MFPALLNTMLVGLRRRPWVGMSTRVENKMQWVDNSDITYQNWGPGEPNGRVRDT